jgi:hypothetical protein
MTLPNSSTTTTISRVSPRVPAMIAQTIPQSRQVRRSSPVLLPGTGDRRDWDEIRAWATAIAGDLQSAAPAR